MDDIQVCITDLRKISNERERDMRHLRLNAKLDQAQEAADEMDAINSAIYFLEEYRTTLNAFQIVSNHLTQTETDDGATLQG